MPKVSVVIVTWNNAKDIPECFESVFKQDYPNFNVIAFDNNSQKDNSVELLKSFQKQGLELLEMPYNLYLTGGNNAGMEYALKNHNPEYILCLNPDTKVEPNLLTELVKTAESDPKIGAVGPKIKFYKNENEGKINSVGMIYDGFMQAYERGLAQEDTGQFDQVEEVIAVSGTCVLYRSSLLRQIGLYERRIKLYLDEIELSIRIRKAGYKIFYTPKSTVWHKYMQSVDQQKLYNIKKEQMKAWLVIAWKHYSWKSFFAVVKELLNLYFSAGLQQR